MDPNSLNPDLNTTICAISTPPGIGGIAVARISGPDAITITQQCWQGTPLSSVNTHTAHLGYLIDPHTREKIDQTVATVFRAPASYTGQDTVELSIHGSAYVQQLVIQTLIKAGATPAQPGEFTRRAFANGKIDLIQAEAIADLIDSKNRNAHRLAISQLRGSVSDRINNLRDRLIDMSALLELELDFSEEDVTFADRSHLLDLAQQIHNHIDNLLHSYRSGNAIKNGIPITIVGETNAGKSSTLNALLGDDRAIVSDIHGTTRDIVEDTLIIDGQLYRIMDTAGLRETNDKVEQLGIRRTLDTIRKAAIIVLVLDATKPIPHDTITTIHKTLAADNPEATLLITLNKTDLLPATTPNTHSINTPAGPIQPIKTTTPPDGPADIHNLLDAIKKTGNTLTANTSDTAITNARQQQVLTDALKSSQATIDALRSETPSDLIAEHLRQTIHHLSLLTGHITTSTILTTIFSRFCIGK